MKSAVIAPIVSPPASPLAVSSAASVSVATARRRSRWLRWLVPAGFALGGLGVSAAAHAEENVIILIDQSGSMLSPGRADGTPKWQVARQLVNNFLDEAVAPGSREYALWTFNGSSYTQVVSFAAGKNATQLKSDVAALPAPGGVTPLARSVCEAVNELIAHESSKFPPPDKRIVLQSDGLENSTPNTHECYGPASATNAPPFTTGSWQWKVLNKARTGSPTSTVDPGPLGLIIDTDALFEFIPSFSASFANASPSIRVAPQPIVTAPIAIRHPSIPAAEIMPVNASPHAIPATAPLVRNHPGLHFYAKLSLGSNGGRYREIDPEKPLPQLGDTNSDACVDQTDYNTLVASYGQTVPRGHAADINRDRRVDIYDYLNIIQNMGEGCR